MQGQVLLSQPLLQRPVCFPLMFRVYPRKSERLHAPLHCRLADPDRATWQALHAKTSGRARAQRARHQVLPAPDLRRLAAARPLGSGKERSAGLARNLRSLPEAPVYSHTAQRRAQTTSQICASDCESLSMSSHVISLHPASPKHCSLSTVCVSIIGYDMLASVQCGSIVLLNFAKYLGVCGLF